MPKRSLPSLLWLLGLRTHRSLYTHNILTQHHLPTHTIAVGSLRAGGAGKTPVSRLLARTLTQPNTTTALLSHTYTRSPSSPFLFDSQHPPPLRLSSLFHIAQHFGDETAEHTLALTLQPIQTGRVLLAAHPQRLRAFHTLTQRSKPSITILDSGLHHHTIHHDISIALYTPNDLHASTLPLGPLREDPSLLQHVHTRWLHTTTPTTTPTHPPPHTTSLWKTTHAFQLHSPDQTLSPSSPPPPIPLQDLPPALLLTTIASPKRTLSQLPNPNRHIHIPLPNHSTPSHRALRILHTLCHTLQRPLLTTLKDTPKIAHPWLSLQPSIPIFTLCGHPSITNPNSLQRLLPPP